MVKSLISILIAVIITVSLSVIEQSYVNKSFKEFKEINGKHVLLKQVKNFDKDMFSKLFDSLKVVHDTSIVVLADVLQERIQLIAYVSKDLIPTYNAGKIIKDLTSVIGGSGGGRPDVAQGGGKDASKIDEAFNSLMKGF